MAVIFAEEAKGHIASPPELLGKLVADLGLVTFTPELSGKRKRAPGVSTSQAV
jgi:hypothetical protein